MCICLSSGMLGGVRACSPSCMGVLVHAPRPPLPELWRHPQLLQGVVGWPGHSLLHMEPTVVHWQAHPQVPRVMPMSGDWFRPVRGTVCLTHLRRIWKPLGAGLLGDAVALLSAQGQVT